MRSVLVFLLCLLFGMTPVLAQDLSALARLDPAASSVSDQGETVRIDLALSQPVPWRVRLADNPPRLIMDFREVDWSGIAAMPRASARIGDLRAGTFRPGWSRLVIGLKAPLGILSAEMETGQGTRVQVRLGPATPSDFARQAGLPEPAEWSLPEPADLPPPVLRGAGPLIVVLDPGHGGIDPGAERDGHTEAALMLTFARELKEVLLRDGAFRVVMTREEDVFVPLETRISIARAAGGDVFLSLHADALAEGEAVGATIYTLSEEASDAAARALAERHDRDDLLSGIDLTNQDDLVATVLMDMARTETQPRIARLADTLQQAISGAGLKMHRRPIQQASFSVLKSPDIPSVLIEIGFLSSASDLDRLLDPEWRGRMAAALRDGLRRWADTEAALRAMDQP
ncbi:N-acetylmuramoyl-L-alanine amidase [Rhodobacter sp. HX-7-19]|uniref:N-acetylmuramoyl-L-alanine amidase n=1 Tax=Paragemmobacter kunshanensis TaxID=2583234 RepID=A0A6M1U6V7_9RHOB|nr:N-acetylmuramoyl-L-alanine amidase [Rhodobacter kunshanensis]NGQ92105.1 N-acetylmuramoyl-L-alanine amidase [Rhodobacter kunshanensis]